ncbi:EEF1A lysine methyltransferase 3 [Caretta caretta]|uniref:EEF1A lysine methyltransferase 3 n=1 Tax=Caretta caretta TaxID=8467 RepID=UPI003F4C1FF6
MSAFKQPPFYPVELGGWAAQVPQRAAADATLEGLEAVFLQEVGLFADTFPGETSYPFGSHMLTIAQHYRAQLGVAEPLWEAALTLYKYFEEQKGDVMTIELPLASKQMQENFHRNVPADHSARAQTDFIIGVDIVCLKDMYPLLIRALQHLGGQQPTKAGMHRRQCEKPPPDGWITWQVSNLS